mmetsp:Transcript_15486/g.36977  ORF Transcript_15486/g.36977 Transcript_15486/m.36977 type:complete len:382 (+) Transcript_15486:2-1147(+)
MEELDPLLSEPGSPAVMTLFPWDCRVIISLHGLWLPPQSGLLRRFWFHFSFWGVSFGTVAFLAVDSALSWGPSVMMVLAYLSWLACMFRTRQYLTSDLLKTATVEDVLIGAGKEEAAFLVRLHLRRFILIDSLVAVIIIVALGFAVSQPNSLQIFRWSLHSGAGMQETILASVSLACLWWFILGACVCNGTCLAVSDCFRRVIRRYRQTLAARCEDSSFVASEDLEELLQVYRRWHSLMQANCVLFSPVLLFGIITVSLTIGYLVFLLIEAYHQRIAVSWQGIVVLALCVLALLSNLLLPAMVSAEHSQVALVAATQRLGHAARDGEGDRRGRRLLSAFVGWCQVAPGWTVFGTQLTHDVAKGYLVALATICTFAASKIVH